MTMTDRTYRIPDLEWVKMRDDHILFRAESAFGYYDVWESVDSSTGTEFWWFMDISKTYPCDSIEDGKRKANAHWKECMASYLEEV